MQVTWAPSLVKEDPLEKEMTTHSSILACKISWTDKPAGYSTWGHKEIRLSDFTFTFSCNLKNITNQKQTYRYREQTSGQWGEGSWGKKDEGR